MWNPLYLAIGRSEKAMAPHSCLENPRDGGLWWAAVHGVAKSRTRLSDFNFTFQFHALEKEMATHSSVLAWRIPEMGEPGGLPSMGSHRVGHDWSDLAAAAAAAGRLQVHRSQRVGHNWVTSLWLFTFVHWRRKWQPTPVFLPGESQGRGSLVGCCLWGRTESDPTDAT